MSIPESMRVGPFTYRVIIEPEAFLGDHGKELCGEADHNASTIRVQDREESQMEVIFWHEALHAIDRLGHLKLGEDRIERMAPLLTMVLRDNGWERKND
jgi:hypothetical protein